MMPSGIGGRMERLEAQLEEIAGDLGCGFPEQYRGVVHQGEVIAALTRHSVQGGDKRGELGFGTGVGRCHGELGEDLRGDRRTILDRETLPMASATALRDRGISLLDSRSRQ